MKAERRCTDVVEIWSTLKSDACLCLKLYEDCGYGLHAFGGCDSLCGRCPRVSLTLVTWMLNVMWSVHATKNLLWRFCGETFLGPHLFAGILGPRVHTPQ